MSQQSFKQQTATGADINFTIDTFSSDELKVYVDGVLKSAGVHYNINPYNSNSQSTVDWIGTAPSSPSIVRIVRETDVLNQGNTAVEGRATYAAGSSVKAEDLNNNQKQVLRSLQEHNDQLIQTYDVEPDAITTALIADGNVTTNKLADDAVTHAKVADNAIHTEQIMDGQVDAVKLNQGSGSEAVVTNAIRNSAVTSSKIADNAVTTTEILNGAVTTAKLAADAIDGTRLANNAVDSEHYTDGSIDLVHLAVGSVNSDKIVNGSITGTDIGNDQINSQHYAAGSIDLEHMSANSVDSDQYVDGSIDNAHYAAGSITSDKLNSATVITASEQGSATTNDTSFLTSAAADARFFNISTGDTIKDGQTFPDNDTTIATTAAINDRIIDLVDDVGGFVPIASETNFPTANPDVNNGAGTLVSIKSIGSTRTPSSGTVTIANGSGSNTVTITGCGSTVLTAGFGVIVETTTTLHTYAFHRLVPKATEVTTVASKATEVTTVHTNINSVNTVATNIANVNAVAADATDIGAVAAKATEIGRLGTADAVADMAILGTADVVSDLNTLGTADVVADMNMLATSDVVADMNMLAVSDVISDMNDLATSGNITAMSTCSTNIASINNASANINSANNFGDQYQVAANNPSTDGGGNALAAGDLYFNTSANELKVYNGSSWQGGVTASGSFAATTGNTFTGDNRYNDGVKALFGTGSDLEIYHDGSNSYLQDSGTGELRLRGTTIRLTDHDGSENFANFIDNGAVELFYDNSKKFETQSDGCHVHGSGGLQIYGATGANSNALLDLFPTGSGAYSTIRLYNNNGVDKSSISSMYGNSLYISSGGNGPITYRAAGTGDHVFETNATERMRIDGNNVKLPDGQVLHFGGGSDLQIYHDGTTASVIHAKAGDYLYIHGDNLRINSKTGSEKYISGSVNGAVELYYDNSKKFETIAAGCQVTGNVYVNDGNTFTAGNTNDLQITHDGTNSSIINNTGEFRIRGNDIRLMNNAGNEHYFVGFADSYSAMYFDNSKKFETTSTGGSITGRLTVRGANDTTFDHVGVLNLTGTDAFNSGNAGSGINFVGKYNSSGSTTQFAQISGIKEDTGDGTYDAALTFGVRNDAEGVNIERVRITSAGNLRIPKDNARLQIGAGQDLDFYHNGSNSYIENNTGNFVIDNQGVDMYINSGNDIYIRPQGGENGIKAIGDGGVELYYDASKKFETKSTGGQITGQLQFADGGSSSGSNMASFGSSDDLKIYHDGTHSYISNHTTGNIYNRARQEWHVRCNATDGGADDAIIARQNGSVELYYDHVEKFKTTSNGATVSGRLDTQGLFTGDNNKILVGNSDDLQIYHDGSASRLHSSSHPVYIRTGGQFGVFNGDASETYLTANLNGAVNLYYDNSIKLNTISAGCQVTGNIYVYDGNTFTAGNSNDGQFYHNGTDTYVSNSTGKLRIRNTHADEIKLDTNSTTRWNVGSTGHIYPDANNTYDIGTSSYRVRNIYTNDLHLSNEGHSNEVDGTWGNWTIQEGESDLFLKNNRSGKKYKFNLTEVL